MLHNPSVVIKENNIAYTLKPWVLRRNIAAPCGVPYSARKPFTGMLFLSHMLARA